jgi:hypothetical protein
MLYALRWLSHRHIDIRLQVLRLGLERIVEVELQRRSVAQFVAAFGQPVEIDLLFHESHQPVPRRADVVVIPDVADVDHRDRFDFPDCWFEIHLDRC